LPLAEAPLAWPEAAGADPSAAVEDARAAGDPEAAGPPLGGAEPGAGPEAVEAEAVPVEGGAPGAAIAFEPPRPVPAEHAGLPVVQLVPAAPPRSDGYVPTAFTFRGRPLEGAQVKLRGRSSLAYPKNSFTLRFARSAPLVPGASERPRRKMVLVTTFDDRSGIRQRLSYDLWSALGPVPIATFSVVVYLDGEFLGLYSLVDLVDEDLFAAHGLATDALYKAVGHEGDFRSLRGLRETYERKAGGTEDFTDLEDLLSFVARADAEAFGRGLPERLDLDSYGAWMILATAACALDTLGKNVYHHRDPAGRWRVVPWDFNASWGQHWDTRRTAADDDPVTIARWHLLFERLLDDPGLAAGWKARYRQALAGPLAEAAVLARVDRLAGEVRAAALDSEHRWDEAHRSFDRWADRDDVRSFDDEVRELRAWIRARWPVLRAAVAAPSATDD
jgi:hypothetical protein